jgi:hypothetical protein
MAISLALVPLRQKARVNTKAVVADIAEKWPGLEPAPRKANPGQLAFDFGDNSIVAQIVPKPIPWGDLERPCQTSWLWSNAVQELRDHAGHLIVTAMGSDEPVERAKLLTYGLAGILGACPEAIGVYWGDSTLVIPSGLFQDMAKDTLPDGMPLYLWIDFRAGQNEDGTTGGFTTGLAALGHMEFETNNASDGVGDLRERLFGLSHYVLENGPVIQDGNTVGANADEKIQVTYAKSMYGQSRKVMRLDFQPARKNRR